VIVLYAVATLVFIADRLSKWWVVSSFMPGESRILVPHVVWWTYVQNTHGAFGLFGDRSWLLIFLAICVLAAFWFSFREMAERSLVVRIALGGILGGAMGNVVDRLQHQYVVDFIDFRWWPVFNVADSCISISVCLLVISTLMKDRAASTTESVRTP
jgi:signal peptidase II